MVVGVTLAVAILGGVLLFLVTRDEGVPAYLEGPWRAGDGDVLPDGTDRADDFAFGVRVYQGSDCDWESVTFMEVAWPPGSVSTGDVRQFVRDPDHVLALRGEFEGGVEPPADAEATGVHTDQVELWIAASQENAAYLRHSNGTFDRWPRAQPFAGCG